MKTKNALLLSNIVTLLVCWTTAVVAQSGSDTDDVTLERPNIVLITIDDLNDWVGYLARNNDDHLLATLVPDADKRKKLIDFLTPNLDRLARQSVVFSRANCTSPLCGPSRVSFLTGMYPSTLGYYSHEKCFRDVVPSADKLITLPQHLKANGYETIEAGKIFHHHRGGDPSVRSRNQSDPVSWTAQHVCWCGVRWDFPPVEVRGKQYPGNPWRFGPETTSADWRRDGKAAMLKRDQRWHQGLIPQGYYAEFFAFGPLPGKDDTVYAPQHRHSRNQTFDYRQADFVATFLEDKGLGKQKFQTDIAPGHEPTSQTVVPGAYARTPEKPFFIAYGGFLPHDPFIAPRSYFDDLESIISPSDLDIEALDQLNKVYHRKAAVGVEDLMHEKARELANLAKIHKAIVTIGETKHQDRLATWREAVFAYLACIRFADDCVGRVLDGYDQCPEKENTIVVLLSDHGWHLGTKEHWAKSSPWHEATHTPFMILAPGMQPGNCGRAVTSLSVYPTLLELAGLPMPHDQNAEAQELEGKSLVPLLENPDIDWQHPAVISYQTHRPPKTRLFVAVNERFRLVRYEGTDDEEFYDLKNDPREINNLAPLTSETSLEILDAYRRLSVDIDDVMSRNDSWK